MPKMNSHETNLTKAAIQNHEELWPGYISKAKETDPELIEIFDNWALMKLQAKAIWIPKPV